MTFGEVNSIIKKEHLEDSVCFDERDRCRANKAVLCKRDGLWAVYMSDERGDKYEYSLKKANSLEEALDDFVKVARVMKRYRES